MVYVDDPVWPYGRMMMCHMIADSTEELLGMADKIQVPRKWIQHQGTHREHFDICKSKRSVAVKLGAVKLDRKMFERKMQERTANAVEKMKEEER